MPSPARSIAITTTSSREPHARGGLQRRLDVTPRRAGAQRLVGEEGRDVGQRGGGTRRTPVAVAQHGQRAGDERVVDDRHAGGPPAHGIASPAMEGPAATSSSRRATPTRLVRSRRALAHGAEIGASSSSATRTSAGGGTPEVARGDPGRGAPDRLPAPDDPAVRVSEYRIAPVPEPGPLAALAASLGVHVVVDKRRRLLLWEPSDPRRRRRGPGLLRRARGGRAPGLRPRARARAGRRPIAVRSIGAPQEGSYADRVRAEAQADAELLRMRAKRRGGPTPRTRGSRSAPPCAPTTAAATPARTSRTPPIPRASARRPRRSARWWPAGAGAWSRSSWPRRGGGLRALRRLRQRLREFAGPDVPIHLADLERVRRTTSLGDLLPLAFGPERLG